MRIPIRERQEGRARTIHATLQRVRHTQRLWRSELQRCFLYQDISRERISRRARHVQFTPIMRWASALATPLALRASVLVRKRVCTCNYVCARVHALVRLYVRMFCHERNHMREHTLHILCSYRMYARSLTACIHAILYPRGSELC